MGGKWSRLAYGIGPRDCLSRKWLSSDQRTGVYVVVVCLNVPSWARKLSVAEVEVLIANAWHVIGQRFACVKYTCLSFFFVMYYEILLISECIDLM